MLNIHSCASCFDANWWADIQLKPIHFIAEENPQSLNTCKGLAGGAMALRNLMGTAKDGSAMLLPGLMKDQQKRRFVSN